MDSISGAETFQPDPNGRPAAPVRGDHRIAVLVPCYNEAATIGAVVRDFRLALPGATIHVFDNNSSDGTAAVARQAGAFVRAVSDQGKGSVIRRMFADVDADVYVMVDGDGTYDAKAAPQLVAALLADGLDMVVGARISDQREAYRRGHRFGNRLLTQCVATLFGRTFTDMLSGYRAFSRRFVKSFPAHAAGFETETELTVHALELRMPVAEIATAYGARPEGSESKLNTWADGLRILLMIGRLFKAERPLLFFSLGFFVCALLSVLLAIPVFDDYLHTGLVPRLPTALLCAALMLFGAILLTCGIVLDTVTRGRAEAKRFAYLLHAPPQPPREPR
jgi:glycosyltransferase involved in cell wall biosynthesis